MFSFFVAEPASESMEVDILRPRTITARKPASRRHSSSSSIGSLRSPRDVPPQRSPAQPAIMRSSFHDISPHPMTPMTPTTPTNNNNNNNNNISKYPMIPEQGHFLYPPPGDYGTRYGYAASQGSLMPSVNHGSSFAVAGSSEAGITMGDFDMSSSYTTDATGFTAVRSKTSMADSSYTVMNPATSMASYEYRGISPMDHMKHYSQYPLTERSYPSSYMFPPGAMTSNTMYPLSGVSGGTNERYYPDVLEEFVDMQAAMHHGIPTRPVRSDYSYTPAILSN